VGECWKKAYQTAAAAWVAVGLLKSRRRRGQNLRVEQRAYRCPFCRKYHLTSEARRDRYERYY
jgi:hypothetical protein